MLKLALALASAVYVVSEETPSSPEVAAPYVGSEKFVPCAKSWTSPEDEGCAAKQAECPLRACDGDDKTWCCNHGSVDCSEWHYCKPMYVSYSTSSGGSSRVYEKYVQWKDGSPEVTYTGPYVPTPRKPKQIDGQSLDLCEKSNFDEETCESHSCCHWDPNASGSSSGSSSSGGSSSGGHSGSSSSGGTSRRLQTGACFYGSGSCTTPSPTPLKPRVYGATFAVLLDDAAPTTARTKFAVLASAVGLTALAVAAGINKAKRSYALEDDLAAKAPLLQTDATPPAYDI